ncbi:Hypothetical protein NTJ_05504 [Nesidiocoris tenuis]|uniref:Uncharacterized protein n=1 Tax=Nesidiocoris tenuis TaxID=355587 RepID=A0ABN7AKB6_9HEMI|nr:Hypothetical protein NTJ_05504 [Nesidiocoris tenuis]
MCDADESFKSQFAISKVAFGVGIRPSVLCKKCQELAGVAHISSSRHPYIDDGAGDRPWVIDFPEVFPVPRAARRREGSRRKGRVLEKCVVPTV